MIFNMGSGASTAEAVKYDNTTSGLEATDVQGAVDELNSNLSNLIVFEGVKGTISSIGKFGSGSEGASVTITAPTKEGYSPIRCFARQVTGNSYIFAGRPEMPITNNTATMYYTNIYSGSEFSNITVWCDVMYIKSDFV